MTTKEKRLGFYWDLDPNDRLQQRILSNNYHELEDTKKVLELIKGDKIVFDIGGNIGYYSILLSKQVKRIYTFEPYLYTYRKLVRNIKLNYISNIKTYQIALSDAKRTTFHKPLSSNETNCGGFTITNPKDQGIKIESDTLDSFINCFDIKRIDFIKVDIEGSELNFIKGAQKTIDKFKPIMMIEFLSDKLSYLNELYDSIKKFNYKFYYVEKGNFIEFKEFTLSTPLPYHKNLWCFNENSSSLPQ